MAAEKGNLASLKIHSLSYSSDNLEENEIEGNFTSLCVLCKIL
jgi:hypothetical protein